ncbi:MAG: hypothetical protein AAFQ83_25010 [Bacteroidota bacterium]
MEKTVIEQLKVDYEELSKQLLHVPRGREEELLYLMNPLGIPVYYMKLSPISETVSAYYSGDELSEEQIRIMREFLIYYLYAPCWTNLSKMSYERDPKSEHAEILIAKRKEAFELDTVDKLSLFLVNLQDLDLDPF